MFLGPEFVLIVFVASLSDKTAAHDDIRIAA